jgi:hypothetical protein
MIEIRVDVDPDKLHAATPQERQEFQTWLFNAASIATSDYGAKVDFSDVHHWIISVPDDVEHNVRRLLTPHDQRQR